MKNIKPKTAAAVPALVAGLSLAWVNVSTAQDTPPAPAIAAPVPTAPAPNANAGGSDNFLPEAFDPQEHATTWAAPPFSRKVLPDLAPEEVPTGPTIWDGWQIAAVDKFGGKFTVGLVTKKNEFRLIKEGETHDAEGVTLIKVESNGVITDTVVHLSGGGQSGTLTFDTKRLSTASKGAPKPKAAPVKAAPRRAVQPAATPQAKAAQAKAQAAAKQEMTAHLNAAAAKGTTATQGNAAAPVPTTRTRRRSVVLPPSANK